jgi:hypothetical protein
MQLIVLLVLDQMFFAAVLRSGVLFSENVSNFKAHKFWNLIAWALDLCDVFPQASDRAAMIWVDGQDMDSLRTESVRWPCVRMHTLRTFGVVGTWNSHGLNV